MEITFTMIDVNKLKGRGRSLYIAVSQSGLSNKAAAEKANYKENTFYSHIRQEFLDYKILAKYAIALNHDFSDEYSEITKFIGKNSFEKAEEETEAYRKLNKKYTALLEKHQQMNEKHVEELLKLQNKIELLTKENITLKNKALKG